ncbi:MAG TPA: hypothetical protein VGG12_08980 [Methylovirgula sp.]|jgi:hypothetical protein
MKMARLAQSDRFFPTAPRPPFNLSRYLDFGRRLNLNFNFNLRSFDLNSFSVSDRAIVTAGIMMAVSSASFATYMVSSDRSHPQFNGADHLMIFAQQGQSATEPIIARVPGAPDTGDDDQGIDYAPTGAIPGSSDNPPGPLYKLPSVNAPEEIVLKDFILRGVSGNVAMVDGPNGLIRLETGSNLPGGGQVLSIEWRKGTFVVTTTRGIIEEAQP